MLFCIWLIDPSPCSGLDRAFFTDFFDYFSELFIPLSVPLLCLLESLKVSLLPVHSIPALAFFHQGFSCHTELAEDVNATGSQVHQSHHIDTEDQSKDCHASVTDLPLVLRIDLPACYEEYHQVLHQEHAELIEVLKSVVDQFCVRLHQRHVPEVEGLERVEDKNEP